jgi:mono/diheme cytochrome c family protein
MMMAGAGLVLFLGVGAIIVRPAVEPAYPTSFYAPAQPYAAASVAHGARLYAENCALCHGADGRGDGPAAASLTVHPADLTAPHLFAHTEGDLYWWVSNGRAHGVMPGFAAVMSPAERWDVINFVHARAAGVLSGQIGPTVSTAATAAIPDFAFESEGGQHTLDGVLKTGPALLALFGRPPSAARLAQLAAAPPEIAGGLRVLAIDLAPAPGVSARTPGEAEQPAPLVGVSADVAAALSLFRAGNQGETDLLLDRAGNLRARWTGNSPGGLPDAATIAAAAGQAARFPAAPVSHAGHAG